MQQESYEHFCRLVRNSAGIALDGQKAPLVASRLSPVAQRFGFRGVGNLLDHLQTAPEDGLVSAVVEAMATHESQFFRDIAPFDFLTTEILPELAKRKGKVRIWSAACSSGQEPYSLAIAALESALPIAVEIVATDFSRTILERARTGVYSEFEAARGLSAERLRKYFANHGAQYSVRPAARSLVRFVEHNLLDDATRLGPFDIVFCRNVLIYFDAPTREKVLGRIAQAMTHSGLLFLGAAETPTGLNHSFVKNRAHWRLA